MAADEYNDETEQGYDSEDEQYLSDDDSSIWDLTGIYHAEEESAPALLPESESEERRKRNSDRRNGPFTDRRRGDRRRLSRSSHLGGKQSSDPMNIYL
ncbi:MAG: hypothetical protein WBW79_18515, partial [Desulfocapsaceae bacterium]